MIQPAEYALLLPIPDALYEDNIKDKGWTEYAISCWSRQLDHVGLEPVGQPDVSIIQSEITEIEWPEDSGKIVKLPKHSWRVVGPVRPSPESSPPR